MGRRYFEVGSITQGSEERSQDLDKGRCVQDEDDQVPA